MRKGFTLIELLVVMAIIFILGSIVLISVEPKTEGIEIKETQLRGI